MPVDSVDGNTLVNLNCRGSATRRGKAAGALGWREDGPALVELVLSGSATGNAIHVGFIFQRRGHLP